MSVKVTYDGTVLTDMFVVGGQSRPTPEFRASSTTVDGEDGESFDALTYGVRDCSFDVTAIDVTPEGLQDAARALMAVMAVREPKRLKFSDERDPDGTQLYRLAVPVGSFDSQEFIRAGRWTLRFRQHDPYLYGKSRSAVLKAGAGTRVQTGGNARAFPTAVAYPSGSYYKLEVVGGDHVKYKAPFAGNKVTVNAKRQRIAVSPKISGADGIELGSRFFALEGDMVLRASAQTELSWRERWL